MPRNPLFQIIHSLATSPIMTRWHHDGGLKSEWLEYDGIGPPTRTLSSQGEIVITGVTKTGTMAVVNFDSICLYELL